MGAAGVWDWGRGAHRRQEGGAARGRHKADVPVGVEEHGVVRHHPAQPLAPKVEASVEGRLALRVRGDHQTHVTRPPLLLRRRLREPYCYDKNLSCH